jgi:cobaltochelatase CobT
VQGPFPANTVEAVGVCSRTLAGSLAAGAESVEGMLARSDSATVGSLRAFGDRLAIRLRFHDPHVHRRYQPADEASAALFSALEAARLDAIGARWLAGIAGNLLGHPGVADDGARWLAFGVFAGQPAPPAKDAIAADVARALPEPLLEALRGLAGDLENQPTFAAGAADWAQAAAPHIPQRGAVDDTWTRLGLATCTVIRQLPERGDPGGSRASLRKDQRHSQGANAEAAPGAMVAPDNDRHPGYRAYTTAHDRVVNAADLASREELTRFRAMLDTELTSVRSVIARLAKRLLRALMARQVREWRFDLDEGQLDGSRLATLIASRGRTRPFKQESESPFPSTVVSLLIDHSGSMRGRPMLIAALTVEIFARVLERCGVKCEVLGFTTREWDGGEPAREWAANGHPEHPGRLNALEHIVIKGADVPWRRARVALGLFLHDDMLKENIDGEALLWAHERLLQRSEARRILVVVSDGTPMDEATMAANGHEYLESHLQAVVRDIETRSPVQLAAIGIGHNVSSFYRNATRIARIEQLGPALTAKLMSLLAPDERASG